MQDAAKEYKKHLKGNTVPLYTPIEESPEEIKMVQNAIRIAEIPQAGGGVLKNIPATTVEDKMNLLDKIKRIITAGSVAAQTYMGDISEDSRNALKSGDTVFSEEGDGVSVSVQDTDLEGNPQGPEIPIIDNRGIGLY